MDSLATSNQLITRIKRILLSHRMEKQWHLFHLLTIKILLFVWTRITRIARMLLKILERTQISQISRRSFLHGSRGSTRKFCQLIADYTDFLTRRRKGTRSFLLSTDYTDYTDFPRDPWRHVGAPQGICWLFISGVSRGSRVFFLHTESTEYTEDFLSTWLHGLYGFSHAKTQRDAKFFFVNWLYGLHCFSSWSSWSVETCRRSAGDLYHLV